MKWIKARQRSKWRAKAHQTTERQVQKMFLRTNQMKTKMKIIKKMSTHVHKDNNMAGFSSQPHDTKNYQT
jgi:hypothetical protein